MSEYSAPLNFIDLGSQQLRIKDEVNSAIAKVLTHGQFIMGPEVREFENALQDFTGAKHVLSCANGTDALTLVLMAWGVGAGDAVFVPSFTYIASAEAPAQIGATPFFVDVSEDTFNIDPESFLRAINDARNCGLNPSVVIAVDLFGQPSDVDSVQKIAKAEGIKVLVDGAQSLGAKSHGRSVGTMGDATTTSFFPAKPLGCYGDGGAVLTNDDDLAEVVNSVRLHGRGNNKYDNVRIGINSRLDTLQAAILLEKLKIFPNELEARNLIASSYEARLSGKFRTPKVESSLFSSWAQYTLILDDRDNVQKNLRDLGIPSVVYYPLSLTQQKGYQSFPIVEGGTPVSNSLPERVLSLPFHPYLKEEEIDLICSELLKA